MELSDLQNKYKNELFFIVGAAPSIRNLDIDLLKEYPVIAVNSGILAVKKKENLYFCSDDKGIRNWSYYIKELPELDCVCLLYEKKLKNHIKFLNKKKVIFYQHKSWFSPPSIYNLPDGLELTKDINKPIIGARTSFNSAVHLAYCMGAKIIVFLGNDNQFSQDGNKFRYFWQHWNKKSQPYRIKGAIQFNKKTQNFGFNQKAYIEYWKYFAEINKDVIGKEIEIINCSETPNNFNFFPKMKIEDVLEKYGEKNA